MRSILVFLLLLIGCSASPEGSSSPVGGSKSPTPNHVITQLTDGGIDSDAGPDALGDARIAVAYCAATILDHAPTQCQVMASDSGTQGFSTTCNTGLSIVWNCDRCGDVEKAGKILGHILMTSDTKFEVKPLAASSRLMICVWDPTTSSFMIRGAT